MASEKSHKLTIVGDGPAGMSAAINGASEGLEVHVLTTAEQLGGKACTTSEIRNYPGFHKGVSGRKLMRRMAKQAQNFGVVFEHPWQAVEIVETDGGLAVVSSSGDTIESDSILVASGAEYKRLTGQGLEEYVGRGVDYGFPDLDGDYSHSEVCVVGGANSAGQAAMFLSSFEGCKVRLLIRGDSIEEKMSQYLCDEVRGNSSITVSEQAEIVGASGNGMLESLVLRCGGKDELVEADHLFVMIGMAPQVSWTEVDRDDAGFALTGTKLSKVALERFMATSRGHTPLSHESSQPGLFVAGDARSGVDKRIIIAAGDGARAIGNIHYRRQKTRN